MTPPGAARGRRVPARVEAADCVGGRLFEETYGWARDLTDAECMQRYLVGIDMNRAFGAAADRADVGLASPPVHVTHPVFDLAVPGSWLVDLSHADLSRVQVAKQWRDLDGGLLPSPFTPTGGEVRLHRRPGTTDQARVCHLTLALPPHHAACSLQAQEAGVDEDELRQVVRPTPLGEVYFRDCPAPCRLPADRTVREGRAMRAAAPLQGACAPRRDPTSSGSRARRPSCRTVC